MKDAKFDAEFGEKLKERAEEIEHMSYNPENMSEELEREISVHEVRRAVGKLKKGKAPGVDGIVAAILKEGGEEILNALRKDPDRIISPIFKDGEQEN